MYIVLSVRAYVSDDLLLHKPSVQRQTSPTCCLCSAFRSALSCIASFLSRLVRKSASLFASFHQTLPGVSCISLLSDKGSKLLLPEHITGDRP